MQSYVVLAFSYLLSIRTQMIWEIKTKLGVHSPTWELLGGTSCTPCTPCSYSTDVVCGTLVLEICIKNHTQQLMHEPAIVGSIFMFLLFSSASLAPLCDMCYIYILRKFLGVFEICFECNCVLPLFVEKTEWAECIRTSCMFHGYNSSVHMLGWCTDHCKCVGSIT